jgi:hypothetical protein
MKRLLITALVLCAVAAASADDDFFNERYIQVTAGVAIFPTKTCVVLTEYDYREIPSYEFLDHQILGASFKILFPIREWVKLGAQVDYAILDYPYDNPGKMSSEFDLHIVATLLSLQMPFSLYYNNWIDVMLIPQLYYYGAGQKPQNMVPGLEGFNDLLTRTSVEWEGGLLLRRPLPARRGRLAPGRRGRGTHAVEGGDGHGAGGLPGPLL